MYVLTNDLLLQISWSKITKRTDLHVCKLSKTGKNNIHALSEKGLLTLFLYHKKQLFHKGVCDGLAKPSNILSSWNRHTGMYQWVYMYISNVTHVPHFEKFSWMIFTWEPLWGWSFTNVSNVLIIETYYRLVVCHNSLTTEVHKHVYSFGMFLHVDCTPGADVVLHVHVLVLLC